MTHHTTRIDPEEALAVLYATTTSARDLLKGLGLLYDWGLLEPTRDHATLARLLDACVQELTERTIALVAALRASE